MKTNGLVFLLIGLNGAAHAQTACPTGVAAGSAQCGPSPASHGANQQQTAEPTIRYVPTGKWRTTWGAVADDETGTGNIGVAVGKLTKSEAEREAVDKCESLGGGKCRLTFAYENQCVAIASPSINGKEVGGTPHTQGAENVEVATGLALPKCSKNNDGLECIIIYTACTKPIFEKF